MHKLEIKGAQKYFIDHLATETWFNSDPMEEKELFIL